MWSVLMAVADAREKPAPLLPAGLEEYGMVVPHTAVDGRDAVAAAAVGGSWND